jgi:dienelactone hydrolase
MEADSTSLFEYDAGSPLNYSEGKVEIVGATKVTEVSYDSPTFGRVPAYVVSPAMTNKTKYPGIVYMHWGQGNRSEFLSEAVEMTRVGAVSILIDAPYWRPDVPSFQPGVDGEKEKQAYVQLVVDLRRAIDVLIARNDVDPKRIGYVGHSLGATWGGVLVAVENRFKVFVLIGGLPSLTNYDDTSFMAEVQRLTTPRDKFEEWAKAIEPINPERFVGGSGKAKIYFQWARHDMFISQVSAQRYFAAARQPKEQKWYFTSHEFNDRASRQDREGWLKKELCIRAD